MTDIESIPISPITEDTPINPTNTQREEPVNWDSYTTSKSVAQSNLNWTAIGAQISLLLEVFNRPDLTGYQIGLVVLISISLSFQLIIFAMVATLAAAKGSTVGRGKLKCNIVATNSLITFLTGCVLILALAIASISVYAKLAGGEVPTPLTNATG
jgi:Ninjurin